MEIKDIYINPKNPRYIKDDRYQLLKKNLKKFPKMMKLRPIIIDDSGMILGGNMRYLAMIDLGYTEIPDGWVVKASELTEEERRKFIILDNVQFGNWDYEILANEWDLEDLQDWGIEFPELEIRNIESNEKDDEIPEPLKEPKSKLGDLYQLGNHRLLCGDATKTEDVERLMGGKKANMVFTDPPYGLGGYGGRKKMELRGDDFKDIKKFYDCIPLDVPEVYIWGNYKNLMHHLKEEPRDVIVWRKNNFGLGSGYRGQYELIFYYGNFSGSDSDVWDISKDINYKHPTQKPIELAIRAIKNSSKINDIIEDLFGGSGSTLIACEKLNRICYMMEIDPIYCDVIINRWENYTGKKAVKINGRK